MRLRTATCVALATVLAGCSLTSGSREASGWGSSFGDPNANVTGSEANTAISVLVNNEFGDALDPSDRKAAEEAQNRALRARGVEFLSPGRTSAPGAAVRCGLARSILSMTHLAGNSPTKWCSTGAF